MAIISATMGKNTLDEMEQPSKSTKKSLKLGAILNMTERSRFISKAKYSTSQIQDYAPTTDAKETEVERFYEDFQHLLEHTPKKKDVLFMIGDQNAKVGSQQIPGATGKLGLGVQNEAGQRLTEFCQKNTLVMANTLSNNT